MRYIMWDCTDTFEMHSKCKCRVLMKHNVNTQRLVSTEMFVRVRVENRHETCVPYNVVRSIVYRTAQYTAN